jgi:hypothetical protein
MTSILGEDLRFDAGNARDPGRGEKPLVKFAAVERFT